MNSKFSSHINKLPVLMEQLRNNSLLGRSNLENVPCSGIYVFYEDAKPIYVGRSNNIKNRIQNHSRPSSGHNSASFAFILAKEKASELGINIKVERKILEEDDHFKRLFRDAKSRVEKMLVRIIDIDDQIVQTLFEVYASVELDTKYNDFGTH